MAAFPCEVGGIEQLWIAPDEVDDVPPPVNMAIRTAERVLIGEYMIDAGSKSTAHFPARQRFTGAARAIQGEVSARERGCTFGGVDEGNGKHGLPVLLPAPSQALGMGGAAAQLRGLHLGENRLDPGESRRIIRAADNRLCGDAVSDITAVALILMHEPL